MTDYRFETLSNKEKYEMSYRINDTKNYFRTVKETESWLKENEEWDRFLRDCLTENGYYVSWDYEIPMSITKALIKKYKGV